jgi:hypothetical protein
MQQREEVAIDRLLSIIQTIQLGRKTGLLTARRGEGASAEKGTILFTRGQITEVRLGERTGTDALIALNTWGHCAFTFALSNEQNTPPSTAAANGNLDSVTTSNPHPFIAISPLRRSSGALSRDERTSAGQEQMLPPVAISAAPYHIVSAEAALRAIEHMDLSRTHRQLLLLIDGQRTIADLSRLTRRSLKDVYILLRDLERSTVIRIPGEPSRQ